MFHPITTREQWVGILARIQLPAMSQPQLRATLFFLQICVGSGHVLLEILELSTSFGFPQSCQRSSRHRFEARQAQLTKVLEYHMGTKRKRTLELSPIP